MTKLKRFGQFVKESAEVAPETTPARPTVEPDTKPGREQRPSPIRRDRPAVTPDPQLRMDMTEDEDEYIGTVLMNQLADMLGEEVIDGQIEYNGQVINFYSEDEKFHIDNKKFDTPEDVVAFLEGEESDYEDEGEGDTGDDDFESNDFESDDEEDLSDY